jgi:flagellar protein FliJ
VRPFVFRAEQALELRRRQEQEAQRELAAAERRAREAEGELCAVRERLARTLQEGAEEERQAGDLTRRVWYRNWIAGQRLLVERSECVLDQRRQAVRAAAERALLTHRKRKALETFRQRSLEAWTRAALHEEQKGIDDLATSRYARSRRGGQG